MAGCVWAAAVAAVVAAAVAAGTLPVLLLRRFDPGHALVLCVRIARRTRH